MNKSTEAVAQIAAMFQINQGQYFRRDVEALEHSAQFGDRDVDEEEQHLWESIEDWDEIDWQLANESVVAVSEAMNADEPDGFGD